jgi:hypothetical protein
MISGRDVGFGGRGDGSGDGMGDFVTSVCFGVMLGSFDKRLRFVSDFIGLGEPLDWRSIDDLDCFK